MSTVIENQIVQMQFDNKEFEKNISASMQSLDEFKDKMEFEDSEKSFRALEKASEQVDFGQLNKAIDGLGDHFTVIGRTFYKVTDEIANYFTSKITGAINAVKSVTTDIYDVGAGYNKYDQYTHAVKTIMSALGEADLAKFEKEGLSAIDGVESRLEKLMAYTDETSYSFISMVETVGKYLGSGLNIDTAIEAMQGYANWAALAGQNATTATQSMGQMAQTLGRGYVQYADWKEMAVSKNMATTQIQDLFIQKAKELGYITWEEIEQAKKVKTTDSHTATADDIRNWFFESKQLNEQQWLKTDVMNASFKELSSVSDYLLENLEDSNVTMTEMLRAAKKVKNEGKSTADVVATWVESGKIANDEARDYVKMLNTITDAEHELGLKAIIAAQEAVTFQEAIGSAQDAASTYFMKIFHNLIGNYEEAAVLWTDLSNNLWDTFVSPLEAISDRTGVWAKELSGIFDDEGNEITKQKALWVSLSNAVSGVVNIVQTFLSTIAGWTGSVDDAVVSFLDHAISGLNYIGDFLNGIAESHTLGSLAYTFKFLWEIVGNVIQIFVKLVGAIFGTERAFDTFDSTASNIVWIFNDVLTLIRDVTSAIIGSNGFAFALDVISGLLRIVYAAADLVTSVIETALAFIYELIEVLFNFGDCSFEVSDAVWYFGHQIGDLVSAFLDFFGLGKYAGKIQQKIEVVFASLGRATLEFEKRLDSLMADAREMVLNAPNKVAGAVKVLVIALGKLAEAGLKAIGNIFDIDTSGAIRKLETAGTKVFNSIGPWFEKRGEDLKSLFSDICTDIFTEFPDRFKEMIEQFKGGDVPGKVEAVFSFIGDCMKRGIMRIVDAVEAVTGLDLSHFQSKLMDFLENFTDKLSVLKPGFETAWENVVKIFWLLVDVFKGLADALFYIIGELTGIEDMGPDKFIDLLFWILDKMVNLIMWLAEVFATVITTVGPIIIDGLIVLKDICGQLWMAFKYLIHIDRSDEAYQAWERVFKFLRFVAIGFLALKVLKFFRALKWFFEGVSEIGDAVNGWSLRSVLYSLEKMILDIALLMFAIAILARQDVGHLAMGVLALGIGIQLVTVAMKQMTYSIGALASYIKKNQLVTEKDSSVITAACKSFMTIVKAIAKLVLYLSVSISILTYFSDKYGSENMYHALLVLGVALAVTLGGISLICKTSQGLDKESKQLKQAAKVIKRVSMEIMKISLLLYAVSKLIDTEDLDEDELKTCFDIVLGAFFMLYLGAMSIVAITGVLNPSADALKRASKIVAKVGFWTVAVSAAIIGIGYMLDKLREGEIDSAAAKAAGTGAEEAQGTKADNQLLKNIGITFGICVGACVIVAAGVFAIEKVASKKVANTAKKAAANVGDIALRILALSASFITLITGANAMAFALTLMTTYISSNLSDPEEIGQAAFILVMSILTVIGAMWLLSKLDIKSQATSILALSVAMLALAAAMDILGFALMELGLTNVGEDEAKALIGVMVALVVVTALGNIIAKNSEPMLKGIAKFAAGMALISLAMYSLIGAMMLLSLIDADEIGVAIATMLSFMLAIFVLGSVIGLVPGISAGVTALSIAMLALAALVLVFVGIMALISSLGEDGMTTFAEGFIAGVEALTENVADMVEAVVEFIEAFVTALGDSLTLHAEEIATGLAKTFLAILGILALMLKEIWDDVLAPLFEEFGLWLWEQIQSLWFGLADFFTEIAIEVKYFFINLWDTITTFFGDLIDAIANAIAKVIEVITFVPRKLWQLLVMGINWFQEQLKKVILVIWDILTWPLGKIREVGHNLIEGLWNGIWDKVTWIYNKITGFCNKVLDKIKDFFGISSPSKIMKYLIGENLMYGLAEGIMSGQSDVLSTVKASGLGILNQFKNAFGGAKDVGSLLMNGGDLSALVDMNDFTNLDAGSLIIGGIDYSSLGQFDPEQIGLSSVYDMDVIAGYQGYGALDVATSFQPTIKDSQLEQISGAYEDNSQEIIGAINSLKEEVAKQAEIISRYQMVLDTGVLVGEIRDPMNKALGQSAKLSTGRGI